MHKTLRGQRESSCLIDSWGGQTRLEMYDEIFQDDNEMPTRTVKIIPPKCTTSVQPCDVYFYRQVKNFLKKIIFLETIKYAWYASKPSEHREIFMNVNEVCFPEEILKTPCSCKKAAFICCASSRHNWCFSYFYDNYHSGSCIAKVE